MTPGRAILPAVQNAASSTRNGYAAVRKAMKQIGMSTIPVDVWVDGKGLLRQESLSLSLGQGLQNATMKMTFDLHDFGEPVSVEVPPADQVFDALAALKGGLTPYLKQKR